MSVSCKGSFEILCGRYCERRRCRRGELRRRGEPHGERGEMPVGLAILEEIAGNGKWNLGDRETRRGLHRRPPRASSSSSNTTPSDMLSSDRSISSPSGLSGRNSTWDSFWKI